MFNFLIPTLNIHQGTFLKFSSRLPAVFVRGAGPTQVKSWPHSPVRGPAEDTLHSLVSEECELLGSVKTPSNSTRRKLLFAFPPCFAVLRCDQGRPRACAGSPRRGSDRGTCTQCLQYRVEKTFLF